MYSYTIAEFFNIGGPELTVIIFIALLLFGGKKLPELARGLGKGIREFKDASEGVKREIHRNINAVADDPDDKGETRPDNSYHHPEEDQQMRAQADIEAASEKITQPEVASEMESNPEAKTAGI